MNRLNSIFVFKIKSRVFLEFKGQNKQFIDSNIRLIFIESRLMPK